MTYEELPVRIANYAWDYWGPGAAAVNDKSEAEALNILRDWGKQTAAKAKAIPRKCGTSRTSFIPPAT